MAWRGDLDERERFHGEVGITDADLARIAAPYEDGSFEPEPDGKVLSGSHPDAVVSIPLGFAPEEPNAESVEAIHEGDAFLASGKKGRFENGADLIAAAMP